MHNKRRRLERLEAAHRPPERDSGAAERLLAKLLAVGHRLVAAGELPDESQMSVAERAGLLLTRGEYDAALEILKSQAARLQATPRGGHRGEV
jgi:hypothetical protein